jgi:hypothetical protein
MSPANKNALLSIVACVFWLVFIFAKPLGISDPWDLIPAMVGLVLFYFFFRQNKKIQAVLAEKPAPVLTLVARKKRFWLIAVALIIGSVCCIPLMPYMVDNFSPSLYFYVVPADFVLLSFLLFYLWKKLVGPANSSK